MPITILGLLAKKEGSYNRVVSHYHQINTPISITADESF